MSDSKDSGMAQTTKNLNAFEELLSKYTGKKLYCISFKDFSFTKKTFQCFSKREVAQSQLEYIEKNIQEMIKVHDEILEKKDDYNTYIAEKPIYSLSTISKIFNYQHSYYTNTIQRFLGNKDEMRIITLSLLNSQDKIEQSLYSDDHFAIIDKDTKLTIDNPNIITSENIQIINFSLSQYIFNITHFMSSFNEHLNHNKQANNYDSLMETYYSRVLDINDQFKTIFSRKPFSEYSYNSDYSFYKLEYINL